MNAAILDRVMQIDDVVVDRAMSDALGTAEGDELDGICATLLSRRTMEGMTGLILHFHLLPVDIRQTILEQVGDLFSPLRQAASKRNTEGPANVVRIVEQSQTTRLSYLIAEQLRHGTDELRDAAAYCFLSLAHACNTSDAVETSSGMTEDMPTVTQCVDPLNSTYLEKTVDEAVVMYDTHMHPGILLALCALLPKPMREALHAIKQEHHSAVSPLQSLARQADEIEIRRAMMILLGLPTMFSAALDGLRQSIAMGRFEDCLSNWSMLKTNAVYGHLNSLRQGHALWPGASRVAQMQQHARRGAVVWLDSLPIRGQEKADLLVEMKSHEDDCVRLFALRGLLSLTKEQRQDTIDDAIAQFAADPVVEIARIALWYLHRVKYKGLAKVLATLVNSEHEQIRTLAGKHLAPLGFKRLWDQWENMAQDKRMAAGRALLKISLNFHHELSEKLSERDVNSRLRAVSMIDVLNQGEFFEKQLVQLTYHMDERVRATAVKALGEGQSREAIRAIEQALSSENDRVRANAIEAIAAYQTDTVVEKLRDLAADDGNRARANAIGVLMQHDPDGAMGELKKMLNDPRKAHRTSALWLVETLGLVQASRDVAELSISDPDAKVKNRADRVIQELMKLMSEGNKVAD
ncbi:HEAT repeat domain-containing protein [Poriferisphaera sp. WC338]|uniref:HEAT repeat domain-containing protein n=1 Tax=Poriferisphaera sp. WC338 TaxID=3425129 RepID=UPI003D818EF8